MSEEITQKSDELSRTNLLRYYKFDNYICGDSNNFSLAFARGVCESPGTEYNPLFIYSGVGLGKTHLMNAIGNDIVEKYPDKKVLYTSSQQFEAELVDAIQYNKYETFQNHYLQLDVLIMDDIQFLAARETAQHEFFNAFNALFNSGKQIVISSDRPPATLSTLEKRIRSRFEGGIISEILPPDLETRKAILSQKLVEKKIAIPDEVIHVICEHITDDVRKLEGALKETLAFAKLVQRPVTVQIAEQVIKQKLSQSVANIAKPASGTMVRNESPQNSVTNTAGTENPLKIKISLPPQRKRSLIKEATKNISFTDDTSDTAIPDKNESADAGQSMEQVSASPAPANSIPLEVAESPKVQDKPIHEAEVDDEHINQISVTDAFEAQRANLSVTKEDLDNLSLTEAFSSQEINKHVKVDLNQDEDNAIPSTEQAGESNHVQASDIEAIEQDGGNLSLTNIFSSQEVKEKINKIIAVGDTENEQEKSPEEKKKQEETSYLEAKNIFRREHKKKLQYELRHFEHISKKLARADLDNINPASILAFGDKLQCAHTAYADKNYQAGLDFIKEAKDIYTAQFPAGSQKALDTFDVGSAFDTKNIILFGGVAGIIVLIVLILWYLFFIL